MYTLAVLPSHVADYKLYLLLLQLHGKGLVQMSKILCHHFYFKPISFPCISGSLVFRFLKGLGASSFSRRTGERETNR